MGIFCYDFPKTATKVVGKHTKKERKEERKVEQTLLFYYYIRL